MTHTQAINLIKQLSQNFDVDVPVLSFNVDLGKGVCAMYYPIEQHIAFNATDFDTVTHEFTHHLDYSTRTELAWSGYHSKKFRSQHNQVKRTGYKCI